MGNELITIPQYTADDFYNTSYPYEFLYKYKDDKFALQQLIQKMKAQAGAVGVRSFMTLWNAYLETVQSKKGIPLDNTTQFEGQELELFSGPYVCDEYGVATSDKYGYQQIICHHPIMPVQRLVNIDSGEERLQLAYKKGSVWRTTIVEKSVIASSNSILRLASNGIIVNSENAKALSSYLLEIEQLNYGTIPEQKSVGRLGWVGEHGFSPYVEELVFDGENNFKHIFSSVKSEGSYKKWLNAMLSLRKEKTPGRLFLAASFASVILQPCGLLPFFLHAWGGTETGKTVGLMVAASVWASPKMGDYITTFNSTLVGQEMMATFLNSLPPCIDELQIQSSAGVKDFDRLIYQLTEGIGKTRGDKNGGLKKINTWKCCFITNGEHPISNVNSGGGAVNRIIEFECADKVYSDLVGLCSIINANYGFAGKKFVEYLQTDDVLERVDAIQKDYYKQLLALDSTDKQAASASAILAADHIATELLFKDGNNLTVQEMASIITSKDEVNVNARAYDFIIELVARNINRFRTNEFGEYQGEVWGCIEDDHIYIIKSVFDREMGNQGYNSTTFLSWAKKNGYLLCDNDAKSRKTRKKKIVGTATNCVCITGRNALSEEDFDPIEDDF